MNPTAASLLGLLDVCGGELTGGELVRVAQQRIGDFWTLTRSQVYRELAALERSGHVTRGTPGPRESQPYTVSASGVAAYRAWLTAELPADSVRIPLLLAVAFGRALPSDRLAALLAEQEVVHRARLRSYEQLDDQLQQERADEWTRATLSFGMHYERAVLAWFAELPAHVRGGP